MSSSEGSSDTVCNENGNVNVDDRQMAASMKAKINNQDSDSESRCDGMDPVSNFLPPRTKPLKNSANRRRIAKPTTKSSSKIGSGNGKPQRYRSLRIRASNDPSLGRPGLARERKKIVRKPRRDPPSSLYKQLKRSAYIYFWK